MDVEEVAEELYGLRPAEFVPRRDAYVARAREAKDAKAAKAIAALRRPSLAAWAANLLARRREQEAHQFLLLGEALREAHRTLDAEKLRTASSRRQQLIAVLARTAAALAGEAGQPVSDTVLHEIEQTLHGVLADEEVAGQWSRGRLVKVPEAAVGFAEVAPETTPPRRTATPPPESPAPKEKPGRGESDARRLRDLERARTAAEKADADAVRRERELAEAREARQAAGQQAEQAADRVRTLRQDLREARQAERESAAAATTAGKAATTAERALREARRAAEQAAVAVQRLERHG
ncbi:hypothetical protein [Streptomyces sp. NBC_00572]|uniref:hypothetical protein n=1 Tax=Streptomyces sp. NBC_00572 TaxID=2903664 RepID=UPI0022576ADA|nr:hypothetical protein [Streptomyces sp. NBC_00572]MCX4986754.1 hypothetical protein [Streptomyces sp. NBC_00572]